ncbi:MAG TPA: hypothetical protein VFD36_11350 [Kofleriaceae bacterium]|nr:hypothetical protein [Kofleriaceae bacterium]
MRKLGPVVCVSCMLALQPSRAEAWNPLKAAAEKLKAAGRAIGGVLGIPAGGFIESATTPAIRNFEDAGHRLLGDVDAAIATNLGRAGKLFTQVDEAVDAKLAQVDHSLEARILQVQTGIDRTIDHTFDRIDLVIGRLEQDAQQLLARVERTSQNLVKQIDATAEKNLARIDELFASRFGDVRTLVTFSIQQADDIARQRLEQLDELAGRRLGNLDVIATKQSLSLEGMVLRIAALIGLVGLIAFVAWRSFREVADALAMPRNDDRSRMGMVLKRTLARLVPQLVLAGAGALLLYSLSDKLPRGAQGRADAQIAHHERTFFDAARKLDVIDARYHESQLELLVSDDHRLATYRGQLKKIELLHSLFTRPGQLHTPQGLANLVAKVAEVEADIGDADPDVMIAKAYVLWQVGGSRDDEYEAATLCASALRASIQRRGPAAPLLAPLARNYIVAFLEDPYKPRDAEAASLVELGKLAALPPEQGEASQFDRLIEFNGLIRTLDHASTAAYLDMLAAHADLRVALAKAKDSPAVRAARDARTAAAGKLIDAWAVFDRTLEASPSFASDAMVLSVFTLDDAVLSRARYYATVPQANDLPPLLTARPVPKSLTPILRARIAPLRVAWEQRYAPMLGPNERAIVAYEESRRFEGFEQRAAAFEAAYIDFLVAAATARSSSFAGATRAAGMSLYRDTQGARVTEASRILGVAREHGQNASEQVLADIDLNYRVRRLRFL